MSLTLKRVYDFYVNLLDAGDEKQRIAAQQAWQNRTTQNQWGFYDSHRRAIERLIVPERRGGRICILGAGNCNDLDLRWLTEVYREVHLVDLDAASLDGAIGRQKLAGHPAVMLHAPVDLTGIEPVVTGWLKSVPMVEQIEQATRVLLQPPTFDWGRFETVLSPCVLTQILNPVRNALRDHFPPSHPARVAIRSALRLRHLRTIANLLTEGGRGVLTLDLVSSEKYPDLPRVPEDQLPSLMRTFIEKGRHYIGIDPAQITAAWRTDAILPSLISSPHFTQPWLWHLGLRKSFLVYGATFHGESRVR